MLCAVLAFIALLITGPLDEHTLPERLFSCVLIVDFALLLVFLTRRVAFALIVTDIVFGLILISSVLKFRYLTTPLLAPDLIYFVNADLLEVILQYPLLLVTSLILLIVVPGSLFLAWRCDRPLLFVQFPKAHRFAMSTAGALACAALLVATVSPRGPFADLFDKGMWLTMIDKSFITNFVTSFYQTQIEIPAAGKAAESNATWVDPASKGAGDCEAQPCTEAGVAVQVRHPDIVTILEESTFDPRILQVCTLPSCKRKMFLPDARTRATGFLNVHTWGGGTWTAEFAVLTGLAHLSFGNAGLYAPYNLAPRVSYTLPRLLKAAGYRIIAIYPMSGDFINARNAYKNYGFDAFYEGNNYGLEWESSDSDLMQVFDQIYDQEKKASGKQPLFVFMLTIRQHGPHMTPLNKLPAPFNVALFPTLDTWLNLNLGNYLSRLVGSDQAIARIEKKLLDSDQPSVLLHFGDHQPSFDGAINNLKKTVPKAVTDPTHVTYFMLKTNFRPTQKFDYPVLDISYLGSLLLDVADVQKDAFFYANALMRDRCKGLYLDCKDQALVDSYHHFVFERLNAIHD